MEDLRLSRIEAKLDKLADAVVSLARMEERMLTIFKRIEHYEERQQKIEDRVAEIEKDDASKDSIFSVVNRSIWLVAGIALAFVFDLFKK
jgi:phage shock protein A